MSFLSAVPCPQQGGDQPSPGLLAMASGSARPEAANCPELGLRPGETGPLWDRMAREEVEWQLSVLPSAPP